LYQYYDRSFNLNTARIIVHDTGNADLVYHSMEWRKGRYDHHFNIIWAWHNLVRPTEGILGLLIFSGVATFKNAFSNWFDIFENIRVMLASSCVMCCAMPQLIY
jgi:hypothetical protein